MIALKLVEAVWEKRNLGISVAEVSLDSQDSAEEIHQVYNDVSSKYEYHVFRVPCRRCDLSLLLQNLGCSFIETAITLSYDLKEFCVSEKYKMFCDECSWELMNDQDLVKLYDEIKLGIFSTDRIYLDPYFSAEQAANRYIFWIQDLVSQNLIPHKVIFDGETVGFFCNKPEGKKYKGVLASVYKNFKGTGMGFLIHYAALAYEQSRGFEYHIGNISSNNLPVLKINVELGSKINDMQYILIKHC